MTVLAAISGLSHAESRRYTDPINGFSFIPPADGVQAQADENLYLARWVKAQKDTRKVLWAMDVNRWVANIVDKKKKELSEEQYAKLPMSVFKDIIISEFNTDEVKIDSEKVIKIDSHDAIEITGTITREKLTDAGLTVEKEIVKNWFSQIWVRIAPRVFITFKMVADDKSRKTAETLWKGVVDSIEISDTQKTLTQQQLKTRRAESVIEKLRQDGIKSVFITDPQWFLVEKEGKTIGWFSSKAFRKELNNRTGFQISSCAEVQPQSDKEVVRLIYQTVFVSDDLDYESWLMRMQIGSGEMAELVVEKGIRQQKLVFCNTATPGIGTESHQTQIPKLVETIYLPRAVGAVVPAIIDLAKPGSYTFAEYSSNKNDFVMREVEVIGPENIELLGRQIAAVHLRDRSHRNTQPADSWVDKSGKILKTQTANGVTMQACSEKQLLAKFPDALKTIGVMRRASAVGGKGAKDETKPYWMEN